MKVRIPKSFSQLPQHEKEKINQIMAEEVIKQVLHSEAELQKIWLQYACIVLHDSFGFGSKRLLAFLGNWRAMYRTNSKLDGEGKQTEYLKAEMARIFGKDGYPYAFIDKLENM